MNLNFNYRFYIQNNSINNVIIVINHKQQKYNIEVSKKSKPLKEIWESVN
jgi:hypothetical protein